MSDVQAADRPSEPSKRGPQTDEGRARALANLKPYAPGQSGNPAGRRTAGATLREHVNALAEQDLTEEDLRRVARDRDQPWARRAAAERVLRTLEAGDIADFTQFLTGEKSLEQLRDEGKNTEVVKKARVTAKGDREIELHDRAKGEFDGILGHTSLPPAEEERNRRLDEGRATDRVDRIEGVTMRVIGPRQELIEASD